ncbi:RNA polymerase sigma-70 factor, ECF subfamily [Nocardioides szechwanensis]|uniref:RNA polymerase sigma-70 factor, ECF subfamily n=1 Tax=Nocardioides szechwanensis TaxID=1005944 RepID=A0A1H0E0L6_9ACTN|nr:sigma-70 family RNA polymerase sigma factor [Nocardioides szechwanensis]SDN76057.1 RNA polymerase sigma-70 factor, ECF subfamily [Nocardioides szechwanensis]
MSPTAGRWTPTTRDAELSQLLHLAASGDVQAFAALYDGTAVRAYSLAQRILRDPAQAEEVTQEAYLHLWRHSARFDPSRGSAISWILMIVHGEAVGRVRASHSRIARETTYERSDAVVQSPSDDRTHDAVAASLQASRVQTALAELTPLQREAVELAYFGGLSHSEVARLRRIPLGTAKTRIRDGLIKLRDVMREP